MPEGELGELSPLLRIIWVVDEMVHEVLLSVGKIRERVELGGKSGELLSRVLLNACADLVLPGAFDRFEL